MQTPGCLLLDDVPLWLVKVPPTRGTPQAAEQMRSVQAYLTECVRSAFADPTGLPDDPSQQIEDLMSST